MTTTINKQKAIELLEQAVKSKGEAYVYETYMEGCFYVDNGEASCIVGHVIENVAPKLLPLIESWERNEADYDDDEGNFVDTGLEGGNAGNTAIPDLANILADEKRLIFTTGAVSVLRAAQVQQDGGHTWGTALAEAKKRAAELDAD